MKLTTKYRDHTREEIEYMTGLVKSYFEKFDKISEGLAFSMTKKEDIPKLIKRLEDEGQPIPEIKTYEKTNVFHIAPNVVNQFNDFVKKEDVTILEVVDAFAGWFNELDRITKNNLGNMKHKAVSKHVSQVYAMCGMFHEIHKEAIK